MRTQAAARPCTRRGVNYYASPQRYARYLTLHYMTRPSKRFRVVLLAVALTIGLCLVIVAGLLSLPARVPLKQQNGIGGIDLQEVTRRIDRLMSALVERTAFSGIVSVSLGGQRVFVRDYGRARLTTDGGRTDQARMPIASLTKQFTSFALLSLERQGLMNVSNAVERYIPETHGKRIGAVAINELLNHTSGLPAYFSASMLLRTQRCSGCLWTADDVVRSVIEIDETGERGKFVYSDVGYALLRVIIERVTREPWQVYMEKHVFAPFELTNTGVILPSNDPSLSKGYVNILNPFTSSFMFRIGMPIWNYSMVYGASGVYSSVEDLAQWGEIVNRETTPSGLYRQLLQLGPDRYMAGWMTAQSREGKVRYFYHDGRVPGYAATLYRVPDLQVVITVLSNSDPINSAYNYGRELLHLVLRESYSEIVAE